MNRSCAQKLGFKWFGLSVVAGLLGGCGGCNPKEAPPPAPVDVVEQRLADLRLALVSSPDNLRARVGVADAAPRNYASIDT
jgi:hypothetical protein